ncbi:hypothetical protein NGI46_15390 [Peribacillus butanolivorans]|nr:hypothetical protein [Peribacillus butanolivorans]
MKPFLSYSFLAGRFILPVETDSFSIYKEIEDDSAVFLLFLVENNLDGRQFGISSYA